MAHYRAAIDVYRESLRLRPNSPATLLQLGHALQQLGRTDEAMAAWQQAAQLAPNDATIQEMIRKHATE
jgi:Flp pilus assembly protein TadD